MNVQKLNKKALKLRQSTFSAFIEKGEAHLGGSFSIIEILIAIYEKTLKKDDKFILSKSHSSYPLCILLKEKGYKTKLTTHLELDEKNGINCTTGSLGHGLPIATGMAFGKKILKQKGKIYPCYETPDELELKRKILLKTGKPPIYDRSALSLTLKEKKNFES